MSNQIPIGRSVGERALLLLWVALDLVACKPPAPEGQVKALLFSPAEGTYETVLHVSMSSPTDGVRIRYTLDASAPTSSYGREYDGIPIEVASTATVKAVAFRDGWLDSEVSAAVFTLAGTTAAPAFSPAPGTHDSVPLFVSMATGTEGAVIRYTIDGSTPTASYGTEYGGTPVPLDSTATLKAVAFKPGLTPSMVAAGEYFLSGTAAAPVFTPAGGAYAAAQDVALSSTTPGAAIRYTIDGSTPTADYGTLYGGAPVSITSTTT